MAFKDDMQGAFDSAQDAFGKGFAAARAGVSGAAVSHLGFMNGFIRLCTEGWQQGWHERNGGNLSYRLSEEDMRNARSFFSESPSEWVDMGVRARNLGGAFFACTGAGRYMANVHRDPAHNLGIVEINQAGDAWRIVWGLTEGGRPTSEFPSHFLIHSVRMQATGGANRVLYHAHPDNVIALTKVMPLDSREITRALWKAMTECIIVFPMGVGVLPWMVPGGAQIARATSELMKSYDAVIWAQHGLFASGPDFDTTFGLMQCIEKAAKIHAQAMMMNGGSAEFMNTICDEGLRAIARELNLTVNEAFLD